MLRSDSDDSDVVAKGLRKMNETIKKILEVKETLIRLKNWSAVKLIDEVLETACDERKKLENYNKNALKLP